jgi:hypothetical protein
MQSSKSLSSRSPSIASKFILLTLSLFLAACSDSDNNNFDQGSDDNPFQELVDQGATRYLGEFTPMLSVVNSEDDSVMDHSFGGEDGPICLLGGEYTMATRDQGSEDLVIYLQGGGACFSDFCSANETASTGIPKDGITDPDAPGNPVGDWSMVYVPYCDGGVHASDAEYDEGSDGSIDRFHRGLRNLSASLNVAVNTFPNPRRILLTGESAGAFGTIFALPLVRSLYPGIPIELVNDSGVAVGVPNDPENFTSKFDYWNITDSFLPASCPNCIADNGHGTNYFTWQLDRDENVRLSLLSYKQDFIIATGFFMITGAEWEPGLLSEMPAVESSHPDRIHSFIANGTSHTFLSTTPNLVVEGISVFEWVQAMLDDSSEWTSRLD